MKVATLVEGATPFPGLVHFTLNPHHIILGAKQGDIEYHFLSLWYDSTWDRTPISQNTLLIWPPQVTIPYTHNLHTVIEPQVFLSNTARF